jgi:hypothetical protein
LNSPSKVHGHDPGSNPRAHALERFPDARRGLLGGGREQGIGLQHSLDHPLRFRAAIERDQAEHLILGVLDLLQRVLDPPEHFQSVLICRSRVQVFGASRRPAVRG